MSLSLIFSFAFFLVFEIYAFLGTYTLFLNMKNTLNRIFFAVCLSMCVWAFSFAIANSAPDYEIALFWRRMASLGWGTLYSLLLHFQLILTERKKVLGKRWIYVLLYLPAAVNVFIFGLHTSIARGQYNLLRTTGGWVNVSVNNSWDWYFNLYYFSFSMVGLFLLWHWGRSSTAPEKKKQAYLLIFCSAVALLLGTITDVIVNTYMTLELPQMAPIISLIFITAIFYAVKKYGLMVSVVVKDDHEEGRILSESQRVNFYKYLAVAFVIGSILNFGHYIFFPIGLTSVLLFSAALFVIGLVIMILPFLPLASDYQDTIMIFFVAMSIPLIMLRFMDQYASNIVWPVPLIFMSISAIFSKRRMLTIIAVTTILTQLYAWIRVPELTVQVGGVDHVARIILYGTAIILALYVNRTYSYRLKENEDQVRFQQMISHISADFVTVTAANLDEKIKLMLQRSGDYYRVDRAYLFLFSEDQRLMTYTHEWCQDGIKPAIGVVDSLLADSFPWWVNQVRQQEVVHIPDVAQLPPEATPERQLLQSKHIRSLLSIPLVNRGRVLGFLGFDAVRSVKTWREERHGMLKVLANLVSDALMKVESEKVINYMAYYDALTGLPNRTLLKDRLDQAIPLAMRTATHIGVMFIDLDSFKNVNDTMGHEGGDDLLRQVAHNFSSSVRQYDTVARFGGDEFLIIIPQLSRLEDLRKVADKIMATFTKPIIIKEQEFFVTASAGIAVFPVDGDSSETLIKNADLAMYTSKKEGKNRYTLCSPDMKEDVLERIELTNSLYRAQERNELVLYYQPQVDIVTEEITGLEALIRWQHPQKGMLFPGTFIPLAEQTGLINPIGQWVLETACRQNKAWQDQGLPPVRMSVNLSVEQFRNSKLVSMVDTILQATGMSPAYLELEITESTIIKEADYIIHILNDLKALGANIAIDDFGTEYSSLSRLKILPIDRIKLDMQFVHGISKNSKDEAITKVIVQLGRNLGLKVIAEGVETEGQLAFLRKRMCDEVQGYYYYRPIPAHEVEAILIKQMKKKEVITRNPPVA